MLAHHEAGQIVLLAIARSYAHMDDPILEDDLRTAEPANIHRILVPVRDLMPKTIHTVRFAQLFADAHHAVVTLIHVSDPRTPKAQIAQFKADLAAIVAYNGPQTVDRIKMIAHDDVAQTILRIANNFDLVILRSMRRRIAGGLMVSDVTTQLVRELTCSPVLFGEPHL